MEVDSDNEYLCASPDITLDETNLSYNLLKSREKYEKRYDMFMAWLKAKDKSISEDVLLAYFSEQSKGYNPAYLWSIYSMLKATIKFKNDIDISNFTKIVALLKSLNKGYKPKKAKTFTKEQIKKFLQEAPDEQYLLNKVVLILGISGACRLNELLRMSIDYIQDEGSILIVTIPDCESDEGRVFTVSNGTQQDIDYLSFYRNYVNLRPQSCSTTRLFLNYKNGKCTNHVVGKNSLGKIPKEIADYLKIPQSHLFTGHCLRRTSTTLIENSINSKKKRYAYRMLDQPSRVIRAKTVHIANTTSTESCPSRPQLSSTPVVAAGVIERKENVLSSRAFPPNFLIGCASSSYQVEGGWNADDKGENIWDNLVHTRPKLITNKDNGDVACDSYHKYKEDVQLIKDIGFNHYRFSISWSRVLPTGFDNVISTAGLAYYHNLIDELITNGIIPVVTLYHWDLPQPLQDLGGWANPLMADYFCDYARVVFTAFGDKVKWWITINEPGQIIRGYGDFSYAPMVFRHGVGDYLAAHTLLRGHAKAYHLYDSSFRPTQQGRIGITISAKFSQPQNYSKEDEQAANKSMEFESGMFAHPIFSQEGDYPAVVRERVDHNSKQEGRSRSRLPTFTREEINELRGSSDFFGLNHYTTRLATSGLQGPEPSLERDSGVVETFDPAWRTARSPWLKVVPSGFRGILNRISTEYNNPEIFITENGFSSGPGLDDRERIEYYHDYLGEMLKALYEDGCKIIGYTAWSILDNFEWLRGYSERFGIVQVDFEDPRRPRLKKKSAEYFKKLLETRTLPEVSFNVKLSEK